LSSRQRFRGQPGPATLTPRGETPRPALFGTVPRLLDGAGSGLTRPPHRGAPARGVDVKPLPPGVPGRAQGAQKAPKTPKMGFLAQNRHFGHFSGKTAFLGLFPESRQTPRGVDVKPPSRGVPGPVPGVPRALGGPRPRPGPLGGPRRAPGGPLRGSGPGFRGPGEGVLHQPLAPGPRGSRPGSGGPSRDPGSGTPVPEGLGATPAPYRGEIRDGVSRAGAAAGLRIRWEAEPCSGR